MTKELIVKEDPKSPISEVFRTLRTNIQFMNNNKKLKTILITSTLSGEGKSWISANLACTFAQAGKKVIILDADMRKGRQYTIFGISPRPGLSNYLSGFDEDGKEVDLADYIQETEVENLYVIPAGNVPPNPSELLVSENMVNLLDRLREICDIIIVDGPPTQLVTDSLILTRIVDSTVIVASSNQTKKDNLRRIIDNIQKVGGKIAGVVINKVQISSKKYEQSYYYGSTSLRQSKKTKHSEFKSKNMDAKDVRNRNTQRARELVSQNKRVNEQENKKTNIKEELKEQEIQKEILEQKIEETNIINNAENLEKYTSNSVSNEETEVLGKTNEILKQINEYLENEKKNLK